MAKKQATAEAAKSSVRVHPSVLMAPEALSPAPYNPKTVSVSRLDQLKASIRKNGFVQPLVAQRESEQYGPNVIIAGHQRLRALKEIAVEDGTEVPPLPVIVLDVDDRTAKALNLAMRDKAELSEDLVGEMLADMQAESPIVEEEVLVMGFDPEEFASFVDEPAGEVGEDDGKGPKASTQAPSLKLDFTKKEVRDAVKAAVAAKTKEGEPSGDALARLLGVRATPAKRAKK